MRKKDNGCAKFSIDSDDEVIIAVARFKIIIINALWFNRNTSDEMNYIGKKKLPLKTLFKILKYEYLLN